MSITIVNSLIHANAIYLFINTGVSHIIIHNNMLSKNLYLNKKFYALNNHLPYRTIVLFTIRYTCNIIFSCSRICQVTFMSLINIWTFSKLWFVFRSYCSIVIFFASSIVPKSLSLLHSTTLIITFFRIVSTLLIGQIQGNAMRQLTNT